MLGVMAKPLSQHGTAIPRPETRITLQRPSR